MALHDDFERLAAKYSKIGSAVCRLGNGLDRLYLQDSVVQVALAISRKADQLEASNIRWSQDVQLVSTELPKRGWYLTGQERCTLTPELADLLRAGNWSGVDGLMMQELPTYKVEPLAEWLKQENVPEYCIKRLLLFLRLEESGEHESATFVGVPLIDELTYYFYDGKTFTNKGKDAKPAIAIHAEGEQDLNVFCERFVQHHGSLQQNIDKSRLADEDYWNRHAIVHGWMQRSMGPKDSAKCLMAIGFALFAIKDELLES